MIALGAVGGALGLAALLVWAGAAVGGLALPLARRAGPAARADLGVVTHGGALLLGLGVVAGALLASGLGLIGLGADHCGSHDGHPHLCLQHGPTAPGWVGAAGLALLAVRVPAVVGVVVRLARAEGWGRALAASPAATVSTCGAMVLVDTAAPLCHTVGVLRPVSLISVRLWSALSPQAARAVASHEAAHRAAHDTRVSAVLQVISAGVPLLAPWRQLWAVAAEELADDSAGRETDRIAVADAIVRVAAAGPAPFVGLAAASGAVEQRVRRLLGPPPPVARRRAAPVLVALALAGSALLLHGRHGVHHLAERVWALGLTVSG